MSENWLLVVNPSSGKGKGERKCKAEPKWKGRKERGESTKIEGC